jgi:tyrosine-protein kinase Etk/Wzc
LGLTLHSVPVYEGASTLRIEEKESNLPEAFRTLSVPVSWLPTEMEELRSRALAADVVMDLGLQLRLVEPQVRQRSTILRHVQVSDTAAVGQYRLAARPGGGLALLSDSTKQLLAVFDSARQVNFGGFSFELAAPSLPPKGLRFVVEAPSTVAVRVAGAVEVTQPSRDVNIVRVSYRSQDRELAWRVPQALVTHYMAQRQELQTLQLRSTIEYLQTQITTIADQLAESEQKLETYRQRNEVIDPQTQASSEITRLVTMQTQRSMLENERSAIADLLAQVDSASAKRAAGQPSPYRRLLALPNLMRSDAAAGVLKSLSDAEDELKTLLVRRTPQDSDVLAVDQRIRELERELRSMATTYEDGLDSQISSLDTTLSTFRSQLQGIPQKELQYARLERQPKILEGVYTMLQTRLKEAEVTVAAKDPSVRIVDAAIPPQQPVWPRPLVNIAAGIMFGLLLGVGIAFTREYLDRAVRTRVDVRGSTGLPVIGLIPRIVRGGSEVALIAEPATQAPRLSAPTSPSRAATSSPVRTGPERPWYTFFGTPMAVTPPNTEEAEGASPVAKLALSISPDAEVIAEAFGMLQTNIAFSLPNGAVKTLVFTSPLPGDGKTTTVVNLALSLAQRGVRVLLVDADVRRGVVHSIFRSAREPGLSEILRGVARFEQVRRRVSVDGRSVLDYVSTGKFTPGSYGLVVSDAMRDLLARVREEYDLVIVDTPPVNIITDAAVLAANADGVIVVARVGVTQAPALSYAVEQLRHVRAAVLGVVLNDINLERDASYDASYKYFQAYAYSAER